MLAIMTHMHKRQRCLPEQLENSQYIRFLNQTPPIHQGHCVKVYQ